MTTPHPPADELLSERFDRETQLSDLPESDRQLVAAWKHVGDCLRSIPVSSVDLVDSVRLQLDSRPIAAQVARPVRGRSSVALVTAAMTMAICCAALWMLPTTSPESVIAQGLSSTFTSQQLASGFANCDIVVVTMPEGKEETADWLQSSFAAHGMHAEAILVDSKSKEAQVSRIVGADVASQDLMSLMNTFDSELNPPQIDEMDPSDMISQFVESLETPSLAEEHFNEFIVVVPKDLLEQLRSGRNAEAVALAAAADETSQQAIASHSMEQTAAIRPVVFVIRRRKTDIHPVIDGAYLQPEPQVPGTAQRSAVVS